MKPFFVIGRIDGEQNSAIQYEAEHSEGAVSQALDFFKTAFLEDREEGDTTGVYIDFVISWEDKDMVQPVHEQYTIQIQDNQIIVV